MVRLGIQSSEATRLTWAGEEHAFCCDGCAAVFLTDPERCLSETGAQFVCPTCLAEKPLRTAARVIVEGDEFLFCRCPCCVTLFRQDPTFYLERLRGARPSAGVYGHGGCRVQPAPPPAPD